MPSLFRLKSTIRYWRLCPPPWWRAVIRPCAFRPAFLRRPLVSDFSGLPRVMSEKSDTLAPRCPGMVGFSFRMAIKSRSLRFEDLDRVAGGERHDRSLLVRA